VPVDLKRLKPTAQVRFPGRTDLVTLVAVRPGPFWEFFFDGPDGPGKHVLAEAELAGIEVVETLGDHERSLRTTSGGMHAGALRVAGKGSCVLPVISGTGH
jgi:hypothetical protein